MIKKEGDCENVKRHTFLANSVFAYHHEPAGRDAALIAGWLVCHFSTSDEAAAVDDLTGCGIDFPTITDGFTTGFTVTDATDCDNGVMLRGSKVSAPTDPLLFRCPEKIIASFPVLNF